MESKFNDMVALDGQISVLVDDQFLWAKLIVSKAQNGGKEVTYDDVIGELSRNGVKANIKEDKIRDYLENLPDDHKSIIVAEATPAENGVDGVVTYSYEPKASLSLP